MRVGVVDQTIRDGPQSLYVENMNTMPSSMVYSLAEGLGRAGFDSIDLFGWVKAVRLVRAGEDPFDHLRRVRDAVSGSRLRWGALTNQLTFAIESEEVIDLGIEVAVGCGVEEFWLFDVLYPLEAMERRAAAMARCGARVIPSIMYTLSPVHTDEWFAEKAARFAAFPGVAGLYVEDTAGVMLPERASSLTAALRSAIGDLPLEVHFHDVNGLGVACYLEAVRAGASVVHTAVGPLGGGASLPRLEHFLANAAREGDIEVDVDSEVVEDVATEAWRWSRLYGLPTGGPQEYDASIYRHQLPGGMQNSLLRQLRDGGIEDRLGAVLAEMTRIRVEFGYPPMATPVSQFVGVQATLNVMTGERFSQVPDEVCHYLLGHYGEIPGEVDQGVLDRVSSLPRFRELEGWQPPQDSVADLRARFGSHLSDRELVLRRLCSEQELAKLRHSRGEDHPEQQLVGRSAIEIASTLLANDLLDEAEIVDRSNRYRLRRHRQVISPGMKSS